MKVLIVCSKNQAQRKTFVFEQVRELGKLGVDTELFLIRGKGLTGYLKSVPALRATLRNGHFDLVHAHYGLSGVIAILQKEAPVVITFHGSDIYKLWINVLSTIVSSASQWKIFVSRSLHQRMLFPPRDRYSIIPCGVDLSVFRPMNVQAARRTLGLDEQGKYVLFPSAFSDKVKNVALARKVISYLPDVQLIELCGYTRGEVNLLLNACNLLLMTSISEGSPQVIKEAMACNCPIVAVDVGDVGELLGETEGCHTLPHDAAKLAERVAEVLAWDQRTNGRSRVEHLRGECAALQVYEVYRRVVPVASCPDDARPRDKKRDRQSRLADGTGYRIK